MTDQEREEPLPGVGRPDAAVGQLGNDPPPEQKDAETPADQAVRNQEQALESGEENVV